jgi:hypothetical protein
MELCEILANVTQVPFGCLRMVTTVGVSRQKWWEGGKIPVMKLLRQEIRMGWTLGAVLATSAVSVAAAQSDVHGRKYKPLPPTSHIVVTVLKGFNGKPLQNAAVVFHAVREGKNDGNLEVKTDSEGKATIDVIEMGSHLTVQVIAQGYATQAQDFDVTTPTKELEMKLIRPRAQVSTYQDNDGKASAVQPGVQEPPKPVVPPAPSVPK